MKKVPGRKNLYTVFILVPMDTDIGTIVCAIMRCLSSHCEHSGHKSSPQETQLLISSVGYRTVTGWCGEQTLHIGVRFGCNVFSRCVVIFYVIKPSDVCEWSANNLINGLRVLYLWPISFINTVLKRRLFCLSPIHLYIVRY